MKYYLKSHPEELIDLTEDMIVGEAGFDGEVYKKGNKAIKLLHVSKKVPAMTEKKAKLFKNQLNLKTFVAIDDLLYDENNKYAGYSMKYEKERYHQTMQMSKLDFINNINDLLHDINQFCNIKCNIVDLSQFGYNVNCICNDRIRPIDMDNYIIDKNMSYESLYHYNLEAIRNLLFQILSILYELKIYETEDLDDNILGEIAFYAYSDLDYKLNRENILEYFTQELNNYDTLDQYFTDKIEYIKKRVLKKYNKLAQKTK